MRLDQATDDYLDYVRRVRRLRPSTQRAYADDLRSFAKFAQASPAVSDVGQVTPIMLEAYVAGCEHLAPRTVARRLSTLSAFFSYLARHGHVAANPMSDIDRPRLPRTEAVWIADADVQALLDAAHTPMARTVILTFIGTGLRRSELLGLDCRDLDLDAGLLRVREGKGGKDRTIPIAPDVADALRAYLDERVEGPSNALFTSRVGTRLHENAIQRLFTRVLERADLKDKGYKLHSLRHTAATRWVRAGMNLRDIQELMGHEDIGTTSRYLHSSPEHLRAEMSRKVPPIAADMNEPAPSPTGITPEIAKGLEFLGAIAQAASTGQFPFPTAVVTAGGDQT